MRDYYSIIGFTVSEIQRYDLIEKRTQKINKSGEIA